MTVAIVLPAWLAMIMGFCTLSNQGLNAAAMHCDPLPVIRDKGAQHGINLGTHTALPC